MNINTFQDQEAICFELLSCIIIMIPYAKPEHLKEKNLALRIFNVFYDPLSTASLRSKSFECLLELANSHCAQHVTQVAQLAHETMNFLYATCKGEFLLDDDIEEISGKAIEFVKVFVTKNFEFLLQQKSDFFQALLQWTFFQQDLLCFQRSLEVWNCIVEDHFRLELASFFNPLFFQLCEVIIQRGQFSTNPLLKNFSTGEDFFTANNEVSSFIVECVNTFTEVSQSFELELFMALLLKLHVLFVPFCEAYEKLCSALSESAPPPGFANQCRDFFTCLLCMERLIMSCSFPAELLTQFISSLLDTLKCGHQSLAFLKNAACSHVHGQVIATLGACWYQLGASGAALNEELVQFLHIILQCIYQLYETDSDLSLLVKAATFIQTVAATTRPRKLFTDGNTKKFVEFVAIGQQFRFPPIVEELLFHSITCMFVLPWRNVSSDAQLFEARAMEYQNFIGPTLEIYQRLLSSVSANDVKLIKTISRILKAIAYGMRDSQKTAKVTVFSNLQKIFPVLSQYLQRADVAEESFELLLAFFQSMLSLMGEETVQQILTTVFELLKPQRSTQLQPAILENLLLLFSTLCQDGSRRFKNFVPAILNLCLETLLPWTHNCKGGAANVELCFQVMLEALNTHWSMFYLNPSAPLQNESIFIHLFEAVYAALRSPELNLFKLCLLRLNELDQKRNLFKKKEFKEAMSVVFIRQLLNVLVEKSHDLASDRIIETIYFIAKADTNLFSSGGFVRVIEELCPFNMQRSLENSATVSEFLTDFPTFSEKLKNIVHDIRYLHFLNS
ncbi:exportin-6-B-like [Zophobas morio]|uniref:exportin-6-B-like n=1 Tax=Zophobas morio TaxID=2755281 RepID=UPI003083C674